MAARSKKSRKRLGGKRSKPPKNFQIFLDENLHRCQPILDVLEEKSISVHRHYQHFDPGKEDSAWLPLVGKNKWVLITTDESFRYNELERLALVKHGVKVFS